MEAIKEFENYTLLNIEVSPNSDQFKITGYNNWRKKVVVKIKSPPTKGKANKEIIKEFSNLTGGKVEIFSGMKSQQKTLKIEGKSKAELMDILMDKI
jgi:uncharacterized protein (TIGR00251 family)